MAENKPTLLFNTEEFKFEKVEKDGKEKATISGNAMPLGEMSRNKVFYRPESVKKAYESLKGAAFLNGHDANKSLGHIEEVGLSKTHVTYRADVDPEEKAYLRKVERGDIKFVSVGCMVDAVEFMEDGSVHCDVVEFVELSAVTVPGFANTSAEKEGLNNIMILAEAYGKEDVVKKLKEQLGKEADDEDDDKDKDKEKEADDEDDKDKEDEKEKDKDDEEEKSDDDDKEKEKSDDKDSKDGDEKDKTDKDDEEEKLKADKKEDAGAGTNDEEESVEEKINKLVSRQEELFSKFDEMINRLSIIEANIDAINDSEENLEDEGLSPSKEEKFEDKKPNKPATKKELDAKNKALNNGPKKIADMDKTRLHGSY